MLGALGMPHEVATYCLCHCEIAQHDLLALHVLLKKSEFCEEYCRPQEEVDGPHVVITHF